jgi:hypothetical protein
MKTEVQEFYHLWYSTSLASLVLVNVYHAYVFLTPLSCLNSKHHLSKRPWCCMQSYDCPSNMSSYYWEANKVTPMSCAAILKHSGQQLTHIQDRPVSPQPSTCCSHDIGSLRACNACGQNPRDLSTLAFVSSRHTTLTAIVSQAALGQMQHLEYLHSPMDALLSATQSTYVHFESIISWAKRKFLNCACAGDVLTPNG